jgi:hypothetical protein
VVTNSAILMKNLMFDAEELIPVALPWAFNIVIIV